MLLALACVAVAVVLLAPSFSREVNEFVDSVPGTVQDLQHGLRDATGAKPGEISRRLQDLLRGYADHPLRPSHGCELLPVAGERSECRRDPHGIGGHASREICAELGRLSFGRARARLARTMSDNRASPRRSARIAEVT
jgi:hypothetical protein